ncbi:MAG: hypothetical protein GWN01_02545 [Nitrosopumilaceae archaeon]|nr:hypothetical protein [Nitrosopumilaceae archaeon]NIT99846.1 hypothetical protein [Nitrosopumilaceae archaeon]NIU86209.1 hypothetical protein [Nitrosopumilaceae archaeon]NIV64971.1 hypothetical protein [Nitrosopumilaceae archaeon]NIX60449.1 hypothetical protein [Nitrosopumilaceae archaeon]
MNDKRETQILTSEAIIKSCPQGHKPSLSTFDQVYGKERTFETRQYAVVCHPESGISKFCFQGPRMKTKQEAIDIWNATFGLLENISKRKSPLELAFLYECGYRQGYLDSTKRAKKVQRTSQMKSKKIKTTKQVRDLYACHLNSKYINRLNEEIDFFSEDNCFMCDAAEKLKQLNSKIEGVIPYQEWDFEEFQYCVYCPLSVSRNRGRKCTDPGGQYPFIESGYVGGPEIGITPNHKIATKKQIKNRMNWIIKQIHKWTDCEIVDEK